MVTLIEERLETRFESISFRFSTDESGCRHSCVLSEKDNPFRRTGGGNARVEIRFRLQFFEIVLEHCRLISKRIER
jgi:hypothetical protein